MSLNKNSLLKLLAFLTQPQYIELTYSKKETLEQEFSRISTAWALKNQEHLMELIYFPRALLEMKKQGIHLPIKKVIVNAHKLFVKDKNQGLLDDINNFVEVQNAD